MNKNTKLFLIVLFLLSLFLVILFLNRNSLKKDTKQVVIEKTEDNIELKNDFSIILNDYELYQIDELNLKFAIVDLRIKSTDKINLDLKDFITNEGIALDNYSESITGLEEKKYFLGKENVVFNIESNDNIYDVKLFVLIKNSLKTLKYKDIVLKFNQNKIYQNGEKLKDNHKKIIVNEKYKIEIEKSVNLTGQQFFINGNEYSLPSTLEIYGLKINLINLSNENIYIEKAKFINAKNNEELFALDSNFSNDKYDNIIGKNISNGMLFFEIYNPVGKDILYQGKLYLKLNINNDYIEVDVDLNREGIASEKH